MTSLYAVGIDLGGTNLRAALVELGGPGARIVAERKELVVDREPNAVAEQLSALVAGLDPNTSTAFAASAWGSRPCCEARPAWWSFAQPRVARSRFPRAAASAARSQRRTL